jgi:exonuclease III
VRGLNPEAHQDALRELVVAERPSIVCLQEIKMAVISDYNVIQFVGSSFDYAFLPAVGTHGGILIVRCSSSWVASGTSVRTYSLLTKLRYSLRGEEWWLTSVYGPFHGCSKAEFPR